MKKQKTFIVFSIFILSLNLLAIKELPTLDTVSSKILGDNAKNIKLEEVKKTTLPKMNTEALKNQNDNAKNINLEKVEEEVSIDDIVDIYEKKVVDKVVYRGDSTEPFTGIFGYVSMDKIKFYEHYKDGLLDGETVWFSEDGVKMVSEFYSKAKLNGLQKSYYANGKLKSIVIYSNNRIEGVTNYDKNGKEIFKSIFKNGTGNWKFYWSNGKVFEEGRYDNYRKDGVWQRYREDGSLDTYFEYKKGRLVKERWG